MIKVDLKEGSISLDGTGADLLKEWSYVGAELARNMLECDMDIDDIYTELKDKLKVSIMAAILHHGK